MLHVALELRTIELLDLVDAQIGQHLYRKRRADRRAQSDRLRNRHRDRQCPLHYGARATVNP